MAHKGRHGADDKLLMALACGVTVKVAAKAAGISVRTAHRRLRDPEFAERLRNVGSELLERTTNLLSAAALESAKVVMSMLQDASLEPPVRLAAAKALLDQSTKYRISSDMMDRMASLDAALKATLSDKTGRAGK